MTQELGPNQTAWLEALESGKYKQGIAGLRSEQDEYCCLGVGCEVAGIQGKQRPFLKYWIYDEQAAVAPRALIDYLGLRSCVGSALASEVLNSLTELNDDGKTFLEIAATIRADPSIYFKGPR